MKSNVARSGFTLLELIVVIAILGVLIGLTIPAVMNVRERAHRATCQSNLKQIGLSLHGYHDFVHRLPPGMTPETSKDPYPFMAWHARLLPYIEQESMWRDALAAYATKIRFNRNPPHTGFSTVMPIFVCPSDSRTSAVSTIHQSLKPAFASYMGVEGIDQVRRDGVLFADSRIRMSDIRDGTSNTLAVGERPPSSTENLGWWYGGTGTENNGTCDNVLGAQAINAGPYGRDCPLGKYEFGPGRYQNYCDVFHFWSPHNGGGANFLFCDGSVRFLSYPAKSVLPALATRAGHEAVTLPE